MRNIKTINRKSFKPSYELLEDRNSPVNLATSSVMPPLTNSTLLSERSFENNPLAIIGSEKKSSVIPESIKNTSLVQVAVSFPSYEEIKPHDAVSDNFFGNAEVDSQALNTDLGVLTLAVQFSGSFALTGFSNEPIDFPPLLTMMAGGGDTGGGTGGSGGTNPSSDYVEQIVDWNMDNDNGSNWLSEGIPTIRDYDVGYSPTEDEVLPLTLVANPVSGGGARIPKRVEWKLQYSQTGEGIVKIWDSPSKLHQLSPSDNWQFTPDPDPSPVSQEGIVPVPFIEGIHVSNVEQDITINWSVKTDYWNAPTSVTTFKQIKATVGPFVKEMKLTKNLKPYFDNNGAVPPNGDGRADFVEAHIEFTSQVQKGNAAKVGYIQYMTEFNNQLSNSTSAKILADGTEFAFYQMKKEDQIAAGFTGSKYTLPLVDGKAVSLPWYSPDATTLTQLANGLYQVKMTDLPGMAITTDTGAVGFKHSFATFVAASLSSTDLVTQVKKETYSSLTRIKWTAQWSFGNRVTPPGYMTANNSPDNVIEPANGWDKLGPNELYGGLDGNRTKQVVLFIPL